MREKPQTFLEFLKDTLPTFQTEEGRDPVRKRIQELEETEQRHHTKRQESHEIPRIDGTGAENGTTEGERTTKG